MSTARRQRSAPNAAILVVEDDSKDTSLLKEAFAQAGIRIPIIFLRGGQEAIDYLSRQYPFEDRNANPSPALMVMNLAMPGISGLDVLGWMREGKQTSQIPVLVIGGIHCPTDISLAYALGARLFLPKMDDVGQWARSLHRVAEMYGLTDDPTGRAQPAQKKTGRRLSNEIGLKVRLEVSTDPGLA